MFVNFQIVKLQIVELQILKLQLLKLQLLKLQLINLQIINLLLVNLQRNKLAVRQVANHQKTFDNWQGTSQLNKYMTGKKTTLLMKSSTENSIFCDARLFV
jgi:hypothetical protein